MTEESTVEFTDEVAGITQEIIDMIVAKYGPDHTSPLLITSATFFAAKRMLLALDNPLVTIALASDIQSLGLAQLTSLGDEEEEAEQEEATNE